MQVSLFENDESGAIFSKDRKYRYVLWRIWDRTKPVVAFIGLNPSTANEVKSDNTITKVVKVARNNGYGGFYMLNLFALVSPDPNDLTLSKDPIKDNDKYLKEYTAKEKVEVCFCWGNFKEAEERAKKVVAMIGKGLCFAQNKNGSPKHPLYCSDNTFLSHFKISLWQKKRNLQK